MNQHAKINGGLCMEITKKYMTTKMSQATMNNTGACLLKTRFHKDCGEILASVFEFIDIFMNNRLCFNPLHSRDFMNPKNFMIIHHVKIWGLMNN
jgi:hypothetical protein